MNNYSTHKTSCAHKLGATVMTKSIKEQNRQDSKGIPQQNATKDEAPGR